MEVEGVAVDDWHMIYEHHPFLKSESVAPIVSSSALISYSNPYVRPHQIIIHQPLCESSSSVEVVMSDPTSCLNSSSGATL